jgi:hypothetical protein
MLNEKKKKHIASWILLAVFLPMLLLSSFHFHAPEQAHSEECSQCAHHIPHKEHIAQQPALQHACIFCQFLSLQYTVTAETTLCSCCNVAVALGTLPAKQAVAAPRCIAMLRAPPAATAL